MARGWGLSAYKVRKCRADRQLLRCGAEGRGWVVPEGAWLARAGEGTHDQQARVLPGLDAPSTVATCPPAWPIAANTAVAGSSPRSTPVPSPSLLRSTSVLPPFYLRFRDGGGTEEERRYYGGITEGEGMVKWGIRPTPSPAGQDFRALGRCQELRRARLPPGARLEHEPAGSPRPGLRHFSPGRKPPLVGRRRMRWAEQRAYRIALPDAGSKKWAWCRSQASDTRSLTRAPCAGATRAITQRLWPARWR